MIFSFDSSETQKAQTKIFEYASRKPGKYILEIKRAKEKRSLSQNKYYFGVVVKILSDETGYTSDEMHQILAQKFLGYQKSGVKFYQSTTKLDTLEFEVYLEKIRSWSFSEHGIHTPLPNEITEEILMQLHAIKT